MSDPCGLTLRCMLYKRYNSERTIILEQIIYDDGEHKYEPTLNYQLYRVNAQIESQRKTIICTTDKTKQAYFDFVGTWDEFMEHITGDVG